MMSNVILSSVEPSKRIPRVRSKVPFSRRKLILATFALLFARLAFGQSSDSVLPGPKPADAPTEWKLLIGIYKYSSNGEHEQTVVILERNQRLYMHYPVGQDEEIHFEFRSTYDFGGGYRRLGFMIVPDPVKGSWSYEIMKNPGAPPYFVYMMEAYVRTDPGARPEQASRLSPPRPIEDLRREALAVAPPAENGAFRKPDLVELTTLDPAIHLDIRYATANDFLGIPVYPQARAFLQRPAAEALLRALHKLQPLGYGLLIHDGYRPWYVTKIFWDATPPEGKIFVADPARGSRHNRGCAVDLTLYDLKTGKPVEMTGEYDEMSPRSFPNYPGGTSLQRWHRDLLRRAMESEGFTVYEAEWWHFDYKDWREYGILNIPFEKLASGGAAK